MPLGHRWEQELWKSLDFRSKAGSAYWDTGVRRPRRCMRLHCRSLSSSTLIPVAPSALLNVICYSLSTQGWETTCSFPKSNLIFNSQQIPLEGLLQAIVVLECSPRSSAPGPHSRSPYPTAPLREPLSERVGTTAQQPCFSSLPNHLESLLKIRFLGLPLDLLHQHHQRKVLKISHFKQYPGNSTHCTSLSIPFSGNLAYRGCGRCKRKYIQCNVIYWGFRF